MEGDAPSDTDQVSGMPEGSLKHRESQGSAWVLWKLGYVALPKSRETLNRLFIWPRSMGKTLIKEVNPLSGPRDSVRPGTYRETLIMATNKTAL
jgi:hypothetical protein